MGLIDTLTTHDSTTILLVAAVFFLYAVRSYFQPVPIAHPLLLGRQSDIGKVRRQGETATYRNYGVGHGAPLPTRPKREIQAAHDVVLPDLLIERTLWRTKITNEQLRLRIQALANGLVSRLSLAPKSSTALILLDDGFEWLLTDLTLSTLSIPSTTITKLTLLSATLSVSTPSVIFTTSTFLHTLLEQIAEEEGTSSIAVVVVGDETGAATAAGRKSGFNVVTLEELESVGKGKESVIVPDFDPSQLFTTAYHDRIRNTPVGVKISHQTLTAGPTAIRQFFTLSTPLSASSTVLSAFPLTSPFGRAVLYTAVMEGASFGTVESTSLFKAPEENAHPSVSHSLDEIVRATSVPGFPRPTHLFLTPAHLNSLTTIIISHASSSTFGGWAWARKLVELASGSLSDSTIWDTLGSLSSSRRLALGWSSSEPWIKAVVVAGGPSQELTFPTSRLALSVPLINAHIEGLSTAPVFASHPFDLQHFPPEEPEDVLEVLVDDEMAHVGPPGANVEVKIGARKKDEEVDAEKGKDPMGKLFYRGPSVGVLVPESEQAKILKNDGWVDSGLFARVHSNGTFRVKPEED